MLHVPRRDGGTPRQRDTSNLRVTKVDRATAFSALSGSTGRLDGRCSVEIQSAILKVPLEQELKSASQ